MQVQYQIHKEPVVFSTLEAAEDYLMRNYPEHCGTKDATMDFCENMIIEVVYCPMCEIIHENNTLCQMPAWN